MPITARDIREGRDVLADVLNKPNQTRTTKGYSPHYSPGEATLNAEALAGVLPNHGGYIDGAPMKMASGQTVSQSHDPDRERRAKTALEMRQAAEEAERKAAGNVA